MPVPRGSPHPCVHRQGDLCLSYDITWMKSHGSRSSAEPGFSHPTERPWSPRLWLHPRGRTISRVPGGSPVASSDLWTICEHPIHGCPPSFNHFLCFKDCSE